MTGTCRVTVTCPATGNWARAGAGKCEAWGSTGANVVMASLLPDSPPAVGRLGSFCTACTAEPVPRPVQDEAGPKECPQQAERHEVAVDVPPPPRQGQ